MTFAMGGAAAVALALGRAAARAGVVGASRGVADAAGAPSVRVIVSVMSSSVVIVVSRRAKTVSMVRSACKADVNHVLTVVALDGHGRGEDGRDSEEREEERLGEGHGVMYRW
jgi:hypothetical protein